LTQYPNRIFTACESLDDGDRQAQTVIFFCTRDQSRSLRVLDGFIGQGFQPLVFGTGQDRDLAGRRLLEFDFHYLALNRNITPMTYCDYDNAAGFLIEDDAIISHTEPCPSWPFSFLMSPKPFAAKASSLVAMRLRACGGSFNHCRVAAAVKTTSLIVPNIALCDIYVKGFL